MVFCEVKFDGNRNGVYYSGQTLSGVMEITNEKPRKVKALTLRIEGYAKCKRTETKGSGRHRRTVIYSGREDYLNSVTYLVGTYNGSEIELSAGLHKFNFSCVLPFNLPTSFESKYGHIRYQIKVEMERPWKIDLKYCFGFTVIKVYDLNYDSPAIRTPLKAETSKNFFMGLSSKSVYISTEIPTRGFVAGQSVPITIATNNESNIDVKEIKVSLKKIIHYNSQSPRTKTRERIESSAEIRHSGVQRKSKDNAVVNMILPAVPPTNIATCSIIQVSYMIQVVAKVSGMHFSPVVRLPVTIGTVPLQQSYHPVQSATFSAMGIVPLQQSYNPVQPPIVANNDGATSSNFVTPTTATTHASSLFSQDLPPPSYQEAMGMTPNDGEDTDEGMTEEKPFSPLYPVLSFGAVPTNFSNNFVENALPPSYDLSEDSRGFNGKHAHKF